MSLAQRLGLLDPPGQPPDRRLAVVLHGGLAAIEHAWPNVDAALREHPAYRLIIAVPPNELAAARRRFSHELVLAGPPAGRLAAWAWRRRWRVTRMLDSTSPESEGRDWARDLPASGGTGPVGRSGLTTFLLWFFGVPEFDTIDKLRDRLGAPEAILCLGNGPTSESVMQADYPGSALFRVNWIWRSRGIMTDPDVVFTADPDLPPRSTPVFVFPRAAGGLIVLRQHLFAGRPARGGYLFLDRLKPPLADFGAMEIPTNGALMIAVAAALRPGRLVIAGMDLYSHPDGRYPGANAIDGYARGHSARCDLALIRDALAKYGGELEILSPNLRAALGR